MWFTTGMWVIKSRSFLGWGRKFILICVWRRITHLKWKRKKNRSLVSSNFTLNKLGVYCFVINFKAAIWSNLINLKRVYWKSDLSMVVGHSIKYQTPLGVRPLNILFVFFSLFPIMHFTRNQFYWQWIVCQFRSCCIAEIFSPPMHVPKCPRESWWVSSVTPRTHSVKGPENNRRRVVSFFILTFFLFVHSVAIKRT